MQPLARFLALLSEWDWLENLPIWKPFNWVINKIWPPDEYSKEK
jgi:hypothetical protein